MVLSSILGESCWVTFAVGFLSVELIHSLSSDSGQEYLSSVGDNSSSVSTWSFINIFRSGTHVYLEFGNNLRGGHR